MAGVKYDRWRELRGLPLTRREVEVLTLVAQALSDEAIGQRLGIRYYTVGTHLANIRAKLAVHSRLEAVVKAARAGVIQLDEQ
jgi:ATP/maltotriose-dependent transcriptional regulator MalT